eukprot:TRINITY_DN3435_c1_g1_i1.p2 TRINITY_DN3435_c1_g1~~TRINITY_DN3435_c1_g1_i1.p2  ORF type:complete len:198 (+),score=3.08 TRINITY_DN3435_c1_g1_i1:80-673(+)
MRFNFYVFVFLAHQLHTSVDRKEAFLGYSEKLKTVNTNNDSVVVLRTPYGKMVIELLLENAPLTCNQVLHLAKQGCNSCRFYRAEDNPKVGAGPPYGLLQGSLSGLQGNTVLEGHVSIRRGDVCMITGTQEFYIATMQHEDWSSAHTVWGRVRNMEAVDKIIRLPYSNYKHPQYGTVMRMLKHDVYFEFVQGQLYTH